MRLLALLFAALLLAGCNDAPATQPPEQTLTVFAAASLTDAMEALADSFEVEHSRARVIVNVAATSLLARQIEQGAPADVFFSANAAWMEEVAAQGRIAGRVRYPLSNRLVIVQQPESPPLASVDDLTRVDPLALADPEHVPAGLYAKEALACVGLWQQVQPQVVPTLDVRAALLAVRNGAAEAAIVYVSDLSVTPDVEIALEWPSTCHPAIRYAAARLTTSAHPDLADAFLDFAADSARAPLWKRFGFIADRPASPAP